MVVKSELLSAANRFISTFLFLTVFSLLCIRSRKMITHAQRFASNCFCFTWALSAWQCAVERYRSLSLHLAVQVFHSVHWLVCVYGIIPVISLLAVVMEVLLFVWSPTEHTDCIVDDSKSGLSKFKIPDWISSTLRLYYSRKTPVLCSISTRHVSARSYHPVIVDWLQEMPTRMVYYLLALIYFGSETQALLSASLRTLHIIGNTLYATH